ncbi:hypothetical protein JGH11_11005 [Dysgonomonas sp. Marseille-P4677]|uniref:hypothetical protein n=1 Tax=Dysgonomonas sp. Marseille-P4677 TaxID=2364790 RepID=UPI001914ABA3|nr:hypothetical protein [Dysgonomonas sp. Marseille-P4677]MBK5721402.1 hypothetical protein [Dysgonomonas sp. Marseille-P4677]
MTDIKKLGLKHIAPYLPYGLKIDYCGQIRNLIGSEILFYSKNHIEDTLLYLHAGFRQHVRLIDIKPLLRPMSDLYKERNGKVDIVELAKIAGINGTIYPFEHSLGFGYKYGDTFRWDEDGFIFEFHDLDDSFPVSNQIGLFEYLFANHYDVYGLIDQGLAIDINNIK